MNAPVTLPIEATPVETKAEATKPVAIDTIVPDAFRALAERLKIKPDDAKALFVGALTTVTLTPEVALAMPGGRDLVREEYALGLRSNPDGAVKFPPGSYQDAELQKALDARYPVPTKRVRNAITCAKGLCWFAGEQWHYGADSEASNTSDSAVLACAMIGGTDDEYPRILALREQPPELDVPESDPRPAIKD